MYYSIHKEKQLKTNNMKPYTVDSYRAGKKPICRNGQEPSEVHYFENSKSECFAACIGGEIYTFFKGGTLSQLGQGEFDLFEQEEVVETWHNVYKDGSIAGSGKSLEAVKVTACNVTNEDKIIKLTYNPNKQGNEAYSVEVVHTY